MEDFIKELIADLTDQIRTSQRSREDGDSRSWGMEQGVLISRREAEVIKMILKKIVSADKNEKLLNQSLLLSWTRQWTDLSKKKKEGDFIRIVGEFMKDYLLDKYN